MDSVVIEKSKRKQYVFSEESIIVKKGKRIIRSISMQDVRLIRYCTKVQVKWLIQCILFWGAGAEPAPPSKSFDIALKNKMRVVRLWLKMEEFEKVKHCLHCPVEIL